ncbi:DUF1127 domain-containing protein [Halopseudomonas nanhaiensis]|uniref:DUF1127 domain-containing protein n=1 Tax=Halopseudomonas nanhaiensis TaxID=2830842 RepID=UPI001CC1468A|nr:DUF1127 domain-containing protein [Halopseudomonas nanhaiensis]UAW98067.1 DUF1127 domain-containing protein [Halopseudomonas nanhaiensis]
MNRRITLRLPAARPIACSWLLTIPAYLLRKFRRWQRLSYERSLLGSMDHRMLRDIGVTPAEAEEESRKPFWRER